MRYWIYWNEMVQGPFELDELVGLRALSDDLPVCLENRQEWLPAGRVADLAPAIEHRRARHNPSSPPPPPPTGPPAQAPLQGEFFGEPAGQQHLFESEGDPKGPFAFAPALESVPLPFETVATVTMPFRFAAPSQPSFHEALDVFQIPQIAVIPQRVIKESPVPEMEEEAAEQKPRVPLHILPEDSPAAPRRQLDWLPWIFGGVVMLGLLGSLSYWLIDRYSSRSAIAEANRLEPPQPTPMVTPIPIAPPPVKMIGAPEKPKRAVIARPHKPSVGPKQSVPSNDRSPRSPIRPGSLAMTTEPEKPAPSAPDPWVGRQNEAISLVMGTAVGGGKTTVGNQARTMLEEMHERELLHAAETGERLYLPDKITWSALREAGPRYRVYLNFMAWQASGERVQAKSYPFQTDLQKKKVASDDGAARQDFLAAATVLNFKHHPMADSIESVLSAVDLFNKQKLRSMIVKDNRHNRNEQKNIQAALAAARQKAQRAIVYFRTKYPEKALQNVAKAYVFPELLK